MSSPALDAQDLNRIARLADHSVMAALLVIGELQDAESEGVAPNPEVLRALADAANERAQTVFKALMAVGAVLPEWEKPKPPGTITTTTAVAPDGTTITRVEISMPYQQTAATRRLQDALAFAVTCAEEVDAERGNVMPDDFPLQPGESRGTGWAETLSEVALRLKIEVEGPRDRRQRDQ